MITTLYLIRHSEKFDMSKVEKYNSVQSKLIKNEKIILSVEGERRAKILSQQDELKNIDAVYASCCVRTLQTAKYLLDNQNLKVNLDERLDERKVGIPNEENVKNWYQMQYLDKNYKTEGGESQKEVRDRMNDIIQEILEKNKGKRIAIFSHGYAITFYLMKFVDLVDVKENRVLTFKYNGKIIFNKSLDAPEVFKLTFKNNKLLNIENVKIGYNK